jgi:hypothetical protein
MGALLEEHLPPVKNREEIFGEERILNSQDEETGRLEQLLIVASDLTIDEVFQAADDFGGIAFPAHIDRDSYSIVSNLGGIPDNLDAHILELSANCDAESFFDNYPGLREYPVLRDSDAHYLWDMSERCNYISTDIQISGAESLIQLLKGPSDQYEIGMEPQTPVI